jgi:hypothetical protein
MDLISAGKKEGARLTTGGNRVGNKGNHFFVVFSSFPFSPLSSPSFSLCSFLICLAGFFIEPTVFADVKDEMTIAKEVCPRKRKRRKRRRKRRD